MQLGMIGLGRMGGDMSRRLMRAGHEIVAFDVNAEAVAALAAHGAEGVNGLDALVAALKPPRAVWMMLPAAITPRVARELAAKLSPGDALIDGGNSNYREAMDLARELEPQGIDVIDAGTSGGVWGMERGYSLMIGGPTGAVKRLDLIFAALAPGRDLQSENDLSLGTAPSGYLHCGPTGAGHFVKMVHNGIEYGMMAAYAEGMNVLKAANSGMLERDEDAETTPLAQPEYYRFEFDLAAVAEVWRHGSVISSWLLDLTAEALRADRELAAFDGRVSDSGEGRWTLQAAIETGVPSPVLSSALFSRFSSRGNDEFAGKVLSAMRYGFGGHHEKSEGEK